MKHKASNLERSALEGILSDRVAYSQYDEVKIQDLLSKLPADEILAGRQGYLAFTAALDRQVNQMTATYEALANKAIKLPAVWKFVGEFYDLPEVIRNPEIAQPSIHRVGTTSFVLKVANPPGNPLALKLIKFRFCSWPSINRETREANKPEGFDYWISSDRYILMSFVRGNTLAEMIRKQPGEVYANCSSLADSLCYELKRAGRVHGDLNPHNIIVIEGMKDSEVRLIDFGVNYLLREGIGDASSLVRASAYLAPEAIESLKPDRLADIYAFGVVLLEMLSIREDRSQSSCRDIELTRRGGAAATETRLDDFFHYRDFDRSLEKIQIESPGLAILIDDLLEPDLRLRLGSGQVDEDVFGRLRKRLEVEFELRNARLSDKESPLVARVASRIVSLLTGDPTGTMAERLSENKAIDALAKKIGYVDRSRDIRNLTNWSLIASLSHFTVLFAFCFYANKYFQEGTLKFALPGLLILLTFSFVAVRYYEKIFSEIDVRGLNSYAPWVNMWMRFCTFYWPPAILVVYHFSPEHWSLAAAYGTGVVAINNYLTWRLGADSIKELSDAQLRTPASIETWHSQFGLWALPMAVYATVMLVIGQLILRGLLKDVIAYTVIILLINFKLWHYNSHRSALPIRNSLMRIFQRQRRSLITKTAAGQLPSPNEL